MNSKTVLAALCLSASGVSFSAAAGESSAHVPTNASGALLTRAEVLADLALWKRAGLSQVGSGELSPDFTSPPYRQLYDEYLRLRNGAAQTQEASHRANLQSETTPTASSR